MPPKGDVEDLVAAMKRYVRGVTADKAPQCIWYEIASRTSTHVLLSCGPHSWKRLGGGLVLLLGLTMRW